MKRDEIIIETRFEMTVFGYKVVYHHVDYPLELRRCLFLNPNFIS